MTFHLLLTTDLSDESVRAFEPAAAMARGLTGQITLMTVVLQPAVMSSGFPSTPGPTAESKDRYVAEAQQGLEALRGHLPEDVPVKLEVALGTTVAATIDDWADEHEVDVIAMATHGRSGFRRVILGSVAEALLRRTHTPILLFPPPKIT